MPASLYKKWASFGASATLLWLATHGLSGRGGYCYIRRRRRLELLIAIGEGCIE
jgi:hypothetical protein